MSESGAHDDIEHADPIAGAWSQDDAEFEGMITREEISSASRGCLAILIGLLILAGLVCVFFAYRIVL